MDNQNLRNVLTTQVGINNVDDPTSGAFQPSRKGNAALTRAENVDLDRTGGMRTRAGRTLRRPLTGAHSGWACRLGAFYVDAGTLYQFDPDSDVDLPIQTGLDASETLSYANVAGHVFWCNGVQKGCSFGGTAIPWGLRAADPPIVSVTDGALPAGDYLVAVAPVTDTGLEGGSRRASRIRLEEPAGILVNPIGIDLAATQVAVYLSAVNGSELFYHSTGPVGPQSLREPAQSTELFTGMGAHPPPAGHIVVQWGGFLIVAASLPGDTHALYFSQPGNPHRFKIATDIQLLPARCVMLAPTVGGFYYALETGGTFYVSGSDPQAMQVHQVDDRLVAEQRSVLEVPSFKFPWVKTQTPTLVALWVSQDGWVAGLPGGAVQYPVEGRVAMDASKTATMGFFEREGLKQLVLSMRGSQEANQLRFSDCATATVTRGGVVVD